MTWLLDSLTKEIDSINFKQPQEQKGGPVWNMFHVMANNNLLSAEEWIIFKEAIHPIIYGH